VITVCYNNGTIKLRQGEIVVIMGERHAGKTYLLNRIEESSDAVRVMDEPTAHDVYTEVERNLIRISIRENHADYTVFASHNVADIMMVDRVIFLRDREVYFDDHPWDFVYSDDQYIRYFLKNRSVFC